MENPTKPMINHKIEHESGPNLKPPVYRASYRLVDGSHPVFIPEHFRHLPIHVLAADWYRIYESQQHAVLPEDPNDLDVFDDLAMAGQSDERPRGF